MGASRFCWVVLAVAATPCFALGADGDVSLGLTAGVAGLSLPGLTSGVYGTGAFDSGFDNTTLGPSLALSGSAAAYAQRLRELPPMQAWYAAALKETWREPGHEAEAMAAGTWLEDLRAA